jgi:DNA replication protein DnaC
MKPHTENLEHASVRQYCKLVRVPAIGANFVSLADQAVKEHQTHIRYLEALLQVENEERDRHAIANRTRDAQLPRMKTLEEFDFAQAPQIPAAKIRELAEGGYIERSEPVVLIGECGTGKSHIWLPVFASLPAGRNGACVLQQRRRWSTNWWKPNRTIRCAARWLDGRDTI